MEKDRIIKKYKKNIKESIYYFSSRNKAKREKWVVEQFLNNYDLNFDSKEILVCDDEPPDILFRTNRFEIKEILDSERKRHKEYKDKLVESKKFKNISDFFELYEPKVITMQHIVDKIAEEMRKIGYSLEVCRNLDLLYYINFLKCGLEKELKYTITDIPLFKKWRSVSFLKSNTISCVLYANEEASDFIKSKTGNIRYRKHW